jgi:5-methylcytosine-specific restriction protein A
MDVLKSRARTYLGLLSGEDVDGLLTGPTDLHGAGELTRGYEAANVVAIEYVSGSLPPEEALVTDLHRFLRLYKQLVESMDGLTAEDDPAAVEVAVSAGIEAMKERWHKRSERNPRLARDAKRFHGTTCMVCDFNFEQRYGELGEGFIEAHHLTPFAELNGRPTQLDPASDFIVVCPNCHRMLHQRTPPLTPDELIALLN